MQRRKQVILFWRAASLILHPKKQFLFDSCRSGFIHNGEITQVDQERLYAADQEINILRLNQTTSTETEKALKEQLGLFLPQIFIQV